MSDALIHQCLIEAQSLIQRRDLHGAKQVLSKAIIENSKSLDVLQLLSQLNLQLGDVNEAIECLEKLVALQPHVLRQRNALANLYASKMRWNDAVNCYQEFLPINARDPNVFFNLAYYQRKAGKFEDAIVNYHRALDLDVECKEEVFLNLAVIYSDDLRKEDKSRELLDEALNINPNYVPAMFNLANLYEQEGNAELAIDMFERVLIIEPEYWDALARLSDLKKYKESNDPYILKLKNALESTRVNVSCRINLLFALAKTLDDCQSYDEAFDIYQQANRLNATTQPSYSRTRMEKYIASIQSVFNEKYFKDLPVISEKKMVFICGMFRSGSTLAEQILAGHSQVTAGGEREYFINLENKKVISYPDGFSRISMETLNVYARGYIEDLCKAFPDAEVITDKRPDNFIYLGLIKSLFPNALIIHTKRNPLDNCLSVNFLRLGAAMSYSNNLLDTAHYYRQQSVLMDHWKSLFFNDIFELEYDYLVQQPEKTVRELLEFLNLPWEDQCLDFHKIGNIVKTASVCQVRRPLYQSSSGRWTNYRNQIKPLLEFFNESSS